MSSLQKDTEGFEKKILHKFADFKNARVLEIGCGEGRLTWKYAAASALTFGFDPDHSALRIARADSPYDLREKVRFTCASANHIPFPKETFDIAVLAWSL
jgi:ubiquinone/menaquinone biosynthesis C-methylase UbiE